LDFTLFIYKRLLKSSLNAGYSFQTVEGFVQEPVGGKAAVMRHDVDRLPENAFKTAKIENENNIKASYYFRIVKESYDETIIKKIADMGHEIGYHYENLSNVSKRGSVSGQWPVVSRKDKNLKKEEEKKLYQLAIEDFKRRL